MPRSKAAAKLDWTLYMIEAENGYLYTGITADLDRRLRQHRSGRGGAKFFRRSRPKRVILAVTGLTRSRALKLEYAVKQLSRTAKLDLIRSLKKERTHS